MRPRPRQLLTHVAILATLAGCATAPEAPPRRMELDIDVAPGLAMWFLGSACRDEFPGADSALPGGPLPVVVESSSWSLRVTRDVRGWWRIARGSRLTAPSAVIRNRHVSLAAGTLVEDTACRLSDGGDDLRLTITPTATGCRVALHTSGAACRPELEGRLEDIATGLRALDDPRRAESVLERATEVPPLVLGALLVAVGDARLRNGDRHRARAAWTRAAALLPRAGRIRRWIQDIDRAAEPTATLRAVTRGSHEATFALDLAQLHERFDPELALDLVRRSLELGRPRTGLHLLDAHWLELQNHPESARQLDTVLAAVGAEDATRILIARRSHLLADQPLARWELVGGSVGADFLSRLETMRQARRLPRQVAIRDSSLPDAPGVTPMR